MAVHQDEMRAASIERMVSEMVANSNHQRIESQVNNLTNRLSDLNASNKTHRKDIEKLEEWADELDGEFEQLRLEHARGQERSEATAKRLSEVSSEQRDLASRQSELGGKVDTLKETVAGKIGSGEAHKAIWTVVGPLAAVLGVILTLIVLLGGDDGGPPRADEPPAELQNLPAPAEIVPKSTPTPAAT